MPSDEDAQTNEPEDVEGEIADYAQVREEREGEVRLYFRDVPANEVARYFWSSGAIFITLMAERSTGDAFTTDQDANRPGPAGGQEAESIPRRRRSAQHTGPGQGELRMRYFFAMGDLVYTVVLAVPSGVVHTISRIYPSAARLEREVAQRMAVVVQEYR